MNPIPTAKDTTMKKFEIAKKITGTVTNHAAGFTTARLIVANTPVNGGLYEKACVFIGAIAIGSAVGAKTQQYVETVFDETKAAIDSSKANA
jgi:hypothetical protein